MLPHWEWEAYDKADDGRYYGRVKSPQTYGRWEWGYFTDDQLRTAGAYRTDTDIDSDEPLFPDGGQPVDALTPTDPKAALDDDEREGDL